MVEEVTEANLVRRILRGIGDGSGTNAYFLHGNLPKAFQERFSYEDVLVLFGKLEWNVKVIEIDRVRESQALNPWKGETTIPKRVIEYRLRPEFFGWEYKPGLFQKILENLHQEPSEKIDFDLTLK